MSILRHRRLSFMVIAACILIVSLALVNCGGGGGGSSDGGGTVIVDTTAPSMPTGLVAATAGSGSIALNWTASTDDTAVTGYKIYRNGTELRTSAANSFSDSGLTSSTTYSYTVAAHDAAGNASAQSAAASATTLATGVTDTTAPTAPANLTATAASVSQINLTWTAATDNVSVASYEVWRGSTKIATVTTVSHNDIGLTTNTTYSYTVKALDGAGNVSAASNAASATTLTAGAADTTAPTVPANLTAIAFSTSQINLTWTASTDAIGVTGYKIYRGGSEIGTSATNSYNNSSLTSNTTYTYTVAAYDAAGNTSAQSTSVSTATLAGNTQYKQDMRTFVQNISAYARTINTNFIVIPQNGHELVTTDGSTTGAPATAYLSAINGVGREDLFYGNPSDNVATAAATRDNIIQYMNVAKANGVQPLVTDYCSTKSYVDDSYAQNAAKGYTSFAADHRELDDIPAYPTPTAPTGVNTGNITTLAGAKNFLYLLNSNVTYTTKDAFLTAMKATNYDAFIIDLFYDDDTLGQVALTAADIASLKTKPNGGTRLVIAYMSIGEAEDYRYYWNTAWLTSPPSWLEKENPEWLGNYKVRYWDASWQTIIYGNNTSYLKKILDAGFDGAYLDIIDAFDYFEGL